MKPRHLIYLFLIAVITITRSGYAQPPQQAEVNQQEKTFNRKVEKAFSGNYLVYLPDDYSPESKQQWPVLLYLHSYDARGEDLQKVKQEGLPFILRSGTKLPFVVIAPQCPTDDWWDSRWSVENVNAFLDEVLETYRVDATRVYLTGWSMGGAGSWRLSSDYASRFAAVVPLCGRSQLRYVPSLQATPVWAFHGEKDTIVTASESQKMIDALQKIGGNAKLSILPEAGHEIWHQVYNDPQLYEWLLKYSTKEAEK